MNSTVLILGASGIQGRRPSPGTYFPLLLQPRHRAEHALLAVAQEAWVHGVSPRKVDELMKALGLDGVSKSSLADLWEARSAG